MAALLMAGPEPLGPARSSHHSEQTRTARQSPIPVPAHYGIYAVPGLPRTNNDLEQLFGSQRYHERRASGRKAASPAAVLRGEVRLIAATTTRLRPPTARELGRVSREQWSRLRQRLDQRRHARTLRTRFHRDPGAYLTELELKACQPTLPA